MIKSILWGAEGHLALPVDHCPMCGHGLPLVLQDPYQLVMRALNLVPVSGNYIVGKAVAK